MTIRNIPTETYTCACGAQFTRRICHKNRTRCPACQHTCDLLMERARSAERRMRDRPAPVRANGHDTMNLVYRTVNEAGPPELALQRGGLFAKCAVEDMVMRGWLCPGQQFYHIRTKELFEVRGEMEARQELVKL